MGGYRNGARLSENWVPLPVSGFRLSEAWNARSPWPGVRYNYTYAIRFISVRRLQSFFCIL